eukprot:TRINITY_DN67652_c0_g1_i1.p1 TRINITY_DN67652_c0_g1~~TRINITY_DN67652_c0_g1_i1.p1  ORF type:complete len:194 (+),score=30.93 TRINITY_DN67652_c0_g1_i1:74-655(+)
MAVDAEQNQKRRKLNDAEEETPEVLIVATGGTLDKAYPRLTGGWAFEIGEPAAGRCLERVTPPGFKYSILGVCAKDSQEITDEDRLKVLNACLESSAQWVVVTHGTDTLIETAQYLARHYNKELPPKKICLTGAMRPERFVDTDAHFNLGVCFGALSVVEPGVYVCMNGRVRAWDAVERNMETGAFGPKKETK